MRMRRVTQYGDEDEVKACVDKYQENRELMDPSLGGIKTLGNTLSMYHQPAQNWQVSAHPRHAPWSRWLPHAAPPPDLLADPLYHGVGCAGGGLRGDPPSSGGSCPPQCLPVLSPSHGHAFERAHAFTHARARAHTHTDTQHAIFSKDAEADLR
jgi:hypothetical protein